MCGGDSRAQGSWRWKLALQTKLWSCPGASQAAGKADKDVRLEQAVFTTFTYSP